MLAQNVIYENKEMKNERLELTDKNSIYFLGPNFLVSHCTVISKVPARQLYILGARFIDCTFEVKQELKNHQTWVAASLKGCRFKGRFSGCDFGHWPEYSSQPWFQLGSIEDCDFTEARLDGCRIIGSDPSTLRFPKWPCFTLLDPIGHAPELRSVKWPGAYGDIIPDTLHKNPPTTKALTYYAPAAAKLLETTPEELRAVIEKLDCIVY